MCACSRFALKGLEMLAIEPSEAEVDAALAAGMAVVGWATNIGPKGERKSGSLEDCWVFEVRAALHDVVYRRVREAAGKRKGKR